MRRMVIVWSCLVCVMTLSARLAQADVSSSKATQADVLSER